MLGRVPAAPINLEQPGGAQAAPIDLLSILGAVLPHWKIIVAAPLLVLLAMYGVLKIVPPLYKSTAEILIYDPQRQIDSSSSFRVSAEYMLILSADDCLLPGALSRAADLMDARPDVGLTFGNVIEPSDSVTETPVKSVAEPNDNSGRRILNGLEFIELSGADNLVATCT